MLEFYSFIYKYSSIDYINNEIINSKFSSLLNGIILLNNLNELYLNIF